MLYLVVPSFAGASAGEPCEQHDINIVIIKGEDKEKVIQKGIDLALENANELADIDSFLKKQYENEFKKSKTNGKELKKELFSLESYPKGNNMIPKWMLWDHEKKQIDKTYFKTLKDIKVIEDIMSYKHECEYQFTPYFTKVHDVNEDIPKYCTESGDKRNRDEEEEDEEEEHTTKKRKTEKDEEEED
jgi:hypothetical protein